MRRYYFRVNPERFYLQVQFMVNEADWATKGEELNIQEKGKEA